MLEETKKWQLQRKNANPTPSTTLRQHLMQRLLEDLLIRLTKVAEAPKTDQLVQTRLTKKILLEDHSWPYMRWDHTQKMLVLDKKKPVQMNKMMQHIQELIEDFRDPTLVVRFHGMAVMNQAKTIPWRLQLNMRHNRPYDLLWELTHNAVWMLQGTALKPHVARQSGLAKNLQEMIQPQKGHGKGKTKQT